MEKVVGNCGRHPGFSMVDCPMCEIDRQTMLSKEQIVVNRVKKIFMGNTDHTIEAGKEIIRKEGINFTVFKLLVSSVMNIKRPINEDQWVFAYESYAGCRATGKESVQKWAEDYYQDWTLPEHSAELLSRRRKWWEAKFHKPPHNLGVLVLIPDEDNHVTSGMWDIDNKWVLLDEYRVPEKEVTHWMYAPELPKL